MTTEIWRFIPGFEGFYEASSLGRIRSVDRLIIDARGHRRNFPGVLLALSKAGGGYLSFLSHKSGKKRSISVHRSVLTTFCGPSPEGYECCHRNGNKYDNRLENLRWGSKTENSSDKRIHGTVLDGSANPNAKLSDEDALEILYSQDPHTQVALKYNISAVLVGLIRNGKAWRHIPRKSGMYAKPKKVWVVNGRVYDTLPIAAAAEGVAEHVIRFKCQGRKVGGISYPPAYGFAHVELSSISEIPA